MQKTIKMSKKWWFWRSEKHSILICPEPCARLRGPKKAQKWRNPESAFFNIFIKITKKERFVHMSGELRHVFTRKSSKIMFFHSKMGPGGDLGTKIHTPGRNLTHFAGVENHNWLDQVVFYGAPKGKKRGHGGKKSKKRHAGRSCRQKKYMRCPKYRFWPPTVFTNITTRVKYEKCENQWNTCKSTEEGSIIHEKQQKTAKYAHYTEHVCTKNSTFQDISKEKKETEKEK